MIFGGRIPTGLPRILVSASEDERLIKFAAKVAKGSMASILSLYVQGRPEAGINHLKSGIRETDSFTRNPGVNQAFQRTRRICSEAGVPVLQIYAIHNDLGEMMLDHAATWGVSTVIMGASRATPPRHGRNEAALKRVYAELPASISLIIHGQ